MSAWKPYRRKDSVRYRAGSPELAIWKKGTIAFTKAADERYCLADYRFAEILFDDEGYRLGIKLLKDYPNSDEIFTTTRGRSNTSIAASPVFKEFGINIDRTRRYEIHEEDDKLFVYLNKGEEVE